MKLQQVRCFYAVSDDKKTFMIVEYEKVNDAGIVATSSQNIADAAHLYKTKEGHIVTPNADGSFTIVELNVVVKRAF